MSSTYSSLKIELIGTGEQAGFWGATTNANLGTALEEAIVGRADVVFVSDANLTLTLTDSNATQTARHFILNVTGTLTATRTLTVPSIDKPYIVENNTNRTITVKTAGGAGVSVPSGRKMFLYVYNDGATNNVVESLDYITALYAGALTLTTPLALTSGGTGSAATAYCSLTTNVTGVLPIVNGGTGTTTPALVAGTNVTISGSWPNQTINATGGGGGGGGNVTGPGSSTNLAIATFSGTGGTVLLNNSGATISGGTITATGFSGVGSSLTSLDAGNIASGILPIARGGTNSSAAPTDGGIVYGDGTSYQLTAVGTTGQVLTSQGTLAPTWTSIGTGTVNSVTATSPVASTGGTTPVISLNNNYGDSLNPYAAKTANFFLAAPNGSAGQPTFRSIVVADGGTGQTSYTDGQLLIGNTTGNTLTKATLTAGTGITVTNGTGSITIAATGGGVSSITGGTGISASPSTGAVTLSNTGVTSLFASTGISLSSSTGGVTITNTGATLSGTQTFSGSNTFTGGITSSAYNITASSAIYNVSGVAINIDTLGSTAMSFSVAGNASYANLSPNTDNANSLGAGAKRWSVVYAVTGTINTSDTNTKQDIADLDETERLVAVRLKGLMKKFRFKDSVVEKGDAARIHVGVIAQDVAAAFVAEGLDPNRYSLYCSDTWWEREEEVPTNGATRTEIVIHKEAVAGGTQKTRLGIRYEELFAFIIAAL